MKLNSSDLGGDGRPLIPFLPCPSVWLTVAFGCGIRHAGYLAILWYFQYFQRQQTGYGCLWI